MAVDLPQDSNGQTMQLVPSKEALATTVDASISTATTINLNAETELLEVSALACVFEVRSKC